MTEKGKKRYSFQLPAALEKELEDELDRRQLKYTEWFREILEEVGLEYSRNQLDYNELVAAGKRGGRAVPKGEDS